MKSERDWKLECLKMATVLAAGKSIKPSDVVPQAMTYFRWIDRHEEIASDGQVAQLATHYNRA